MHAVTSALIWEGVRFQLPTVVSGNIYKITFDYRVVGSPMYFYVMSGPTGASTGFDTEQTATTTLSETSTTTQTIYWTCSAGGTTAFISFVNGSNVSREIYIDNVSVKEVMEYTATATDGSTKTLLTGYNTCYGLNQVPSTEFNPSTGIANDNDNWIPAMLDGEAFPVLM